ncbi:MAG: TonB-dependent receptor [Bacteroidetes bacterium]|nr:TonB-dependent receptor [Bacteroidota bacterium]
MKSFIYILLAVGLSVFSQNLFSQTIISGSVKQHDGSGIPGASIYLKDTYDGATSDVDGNFSFRTSKKGAKVLMITMLGFEPYSKELTLDGTPIVLKVEMKEKFNQLNAVTITAGTFEASDKKQANILTPLDMITTAGAAGDVFGALQTLPGTTTNGESGRLFVKGGDSEESQTFIDGALVYAPYTTSAPNQSVRGRFNPFMFKGTIFSTGGYSAEYGQALSSVLLLNTTDIPDEDQLDLSFMTIGVGAAGTQKWKNGAITASLDYTNLGPYMMLLPQNFEWKKYPTAIEGAFSLRQKTGKTGLLKVYGSLGNSRFAVAQEDLNSDNNQFNYDIRNNNNFLNASWKGSISDKWSLTSSASFTSNKDNINFDTNSFDKNLRGIHLKEVFSHPFNERFTLRTGAEIFSKTYSQAFSTQINPAGYKNQYTNNSGAAFAEAELYASTRFVARLGLRAEYSDYLQRGNLAPRISAAYKLNKNSQFSFAYGWFYQNPTDDYLLYTHKLNFERADHYTFSYQASRNYRTLRAEVYYKDYHNLSKWNGDESSSAIYSNSGYGYATGLDLFFRDKKTIKNGDYWISYSFLDTRRDYHTYPHEAIPGFASKHNIALVYKHWFGGIRSYASVNAKYSSPRVFNDPNSLTFNGEHTKPYRSIDISWSFLYRQNIIFYAAVTNVFGFKQGYGNAYGTVKNGDGVFRSREIIAGADRFYILGCFITFTKKGEANQIDKIE